MTRTPTLKASAQIERLQNYIDGGYDEELPDRLRLRPFFAGHPGSDSSIR